MSAVGILVTVAFGLVVIQHIILALGAANGDGDDGLQISGCVAVPIGLIITSAFVVALAQSC